MLNIEILEFFELNRFRSEDKENDNITPDLKFGKLLLSEEIAEDMVGFLNEGGINTCILYTMIFNLNKFFIRDDGIFKFCYVEEYLQSLFENPSK